MDHRILGSLLLMASLAAPTAMAQRVPLAQAPGKDMVEAACSSCHSLSYIPMNSRFLSPEVWKAEVTKMRTVFGAPIDDDAANTIIGYLVSQYGAPKKP
ncbi:MAG: cytochrome c [Acetobacteraceae bacterium]|nr:cytochrome c [Acetobacteraceae bacterium]